MALSLLADPFFGDPFFGGLGDVFSGLPAGCAITTDVGDAGPARDTGGRRRSRAIPIDLIEAHLTLTIAHGVHACIGIPSPSIAW
jgi:hypothetical protein